MATFEKSFTAGVRAARPTVAVALPLPPNVKKDAFLGAVLEMPSTRYARRSPFEWAGAAAVHISLIALLIIVPLYATGTISLSAYEDTPLIAPPPPPPPAPAAVAVAPHAVHSTSRMTYKVPKLVAPKSIPKKISSVTDASAAPPPELGGVIGGASGGIVGGQVGGGIGGVFDGTRAPAPPPPPPPAKAVPKIVRVGSNLRAPRQRSFVQPDYPPLARQVRLSGTVVVDAIIDEHGNVVQAHALSGHPLLIPAALKAVLQWKYEPTTLNGHPVSVELEVRVTFNPNVPQE